MPGLLEQWKYYFMGMGFSLLKIVLNRMKNVLGQDGVLKAARPDEHVSLAPVKGSFYIELMEALRKKINANGDWIWLKNCLTDDVLRASEIETLTKRISIVFQKLGLQKGQCIHIMTGNHNYSYLVNFAAWHLGAFTSTGDVALDEDTIAGQLDDLKVVKLLICTVEHSDTLKKAANKSKFASNNDVRIVSLGEAEGCKNLLKLLEEVDESDVFEPIQIDDVSTENLIVFWSSGTTGKPKGICWTHQSMANWFRFVAANPFPAIVVLSTQCFFHVGAFWGVHEAIAKGNVFNHMNGPEFTIQKLLEATKIEQPKSLVIGSHHYVQIAEMDLNNTGLRKQDLSSVFSIMPVGTSVPEGLFQKLQSKFPNLIIRLNAYGATEAGPISVSFSGGENMGMLACRVKVKIVDVNTGSICKPGELGEICVSSPYSMKGYLERPEENKQCFTEDGFIRMGDLGFYNERGDFQMVDRMKEIIKYQNNHVSPSEIESILQEHPDIKECIVFGKKDPTVQELISAVIVPADNKEINPDDIKRFANERINIEYKKIRGDIIIKDKIPRNSNGKLLRREMRKWAEENSSY